MHDILRIMQAASSALCAQRTRLNVIANNVANVGSTHTEEGGPYRRRIVSLEPQTSERPFRIPSPRQISGGVADRVEGVRARVLVDERAGPRVHEPDHPDADEDGYVEYPNVDVVIEMTNALSATRSYQASVSVIDAAKQMADRALEIGRG